MTTAQGADRPLRVVQVSDTHLSETHAYFIDNYDVFVDEMQALKPDLIVHTGDISFNGPLRPADLAFAKAQLEPAAGARGDAGGEPRHRRGPALLAAQPADRCGAHGSLDDDGRPDVVEPRSR
ncbi:metallophosphoesterase family protein [Bosea sp. R86505]|uniref:metallophosphoesterase family protein n=1 Tax=Bosea sp. R86505 TaxID=3101710 RepID=UPI00366AB8D5